MLTRTMSENAPLILQLLASSVNIAAKAGEIIRDVMSKGDLGIVDKVSKNLLFYFATICDDLTYFFVLNLF